MAYIGVNYPCPCKRPGQEFYSKNMSISYAQLEGVQTWIFTAIAHHNHERSLLKPLPHVLQQSSNASADTAATPRSRAAGFLALLPWRTLMLLLLRQAFMGLALERFTAAARQPLPTRTKPKDTAAIRKQPEDKTENLSVRAKKVFRETQVVECYGRPPLTPSISCHSVTLSSCVHGGFAWIQTGCTTI